MSKTDEQLAKDLQNGDKNSFGILVDRYEKPLCAYILRMLGDRNSCEDTLQETFLKVYKNINSFDIKKKFSSWIYRVAHNEAISYYRKNRPTVDLDEVAEFASEENNELSIQKKLDSLKYNKILEKALQTIPLKYREVIVLRYFEQKSYEEISEILHLPANTVGTYLSRGKKEIKKHFKNIDIEEII